MQIFIAFLNTKSTFLFDLIKCDLAEKPQGWKSGFSVRSVF